MSNFLDKVVFITGSGTGIGRAIALSFATEGARLILTDINTDHLEQLAKDVAILTNIKPLTYKMDVTNASQVEMVIALAVEEYGRIDVLINNAGVSSMVKVIDMTEADWDFNMNVNAKGQFLVTKAVLPHMIAVKSGKIVNTASMASKLGAPLLAHYSASKFAVVGFTQAVAKEVAQYGINVNAVCPGFVATGMQDREVVWEAKLRELTPEKVRQEYIDQTPLGRLCYPEDVAKVVLFLASPAADFMTGQAINVTGGACTH
ncbi:MAG TPA: 3-ketoacyl-ACP reductase [Firmicutes bacterium]|jgi:meso-butanediol dehydrogenase / (S,S)-butanediol dehydrogenase / diacetyl reductase|nr:3-ketoacyl-ACP reductase [Bacillota bacterium]